MLSILQIPILIFKALFKIIQVYELSANVSTLLADTTGEQINNFSGAVRRAT